MRKRVYVAAPITKGVLADNIAVAMAAGVTLLRAGFAPFVPHGSCYFGGPVPAVTPAGTTHEDWMGVDLPWVGVADAVLRLPGESVGADLEVAHARGLGVPVFYCLDDLIAALAEQN